VEVRVKRKRPNSALRNKALLRHLRQAAKQLANNQPIPRLTEEQSVVLAKELGVSRSYLPLVTSASLMAGLDSIKAQMPRRLYQDAKNRVLMSSVIDMVSQFVRPMDAPFLPPGFRIELRIPKKRKAGGSK
jgi:hypothetical protein